MACSIPVDHRIEKIPSRDFFNDTMRVVSEIRLDPTFQFKAGVQQRYLEEAMRNNQRMLEKQLLENTWERSYWNSDTAMQYQPVDFRNYFYKENYFSETSKSFEKKFSSVRSELQSWVSDWLKDIRII
jgi:hypothetical protein